MTETATQLDTIKSAYPAQYYGVYDPSATGVTALTDVLDVWNATTVTGSALDLSGLAAASSMVALTAEQFALADGASAIWVAAGALLYPARYYASYDTTAPQPTAVTGWYDTWGLSSVAEVPAATAMIAVAATDWADVAKFRTSDGRGVQGGVIVDYTPPAPAVPLATQAATALAAARTYVGNTYTMLNEATPDAWVAYLKALMAITSGADTTSTALPDAPAT